MNKNIQWQRLSVLVASVGLLGGCVGGSKTATPSEPADREIASVEGYMSQPVRTVFKRSCESCHGIDGKGIAGIAPDLKKSKPRSVGEWETYLRTSSDSHPVSQTPPVWLDADEVAIIADYLASFSQENQPQQPKE